MPFINIYKECVLNFMDKFLWSDTFLKVWIFIKNVLETFIYNS